MVNLVNAVSLLQVLYWLTSCLTVPFKIIMLDVLKYFCLFYQIRSQQTIHIKLSVLENKNNQSTVLKCKYFYAACNGQS